MCGRFYVEKDDPEIMRIVFSASNDAEPKTGEVYPSDTVAVISPSGEPTTMRWGFSRYDGKGEIINARSETAAEKNMFRRALMEERCLVPASWYFEWEKRGGKKIKYALEARDSAVTWLAGLARTDAITGERSFVILTRPVWGGIAFIHDRMPVILPRELHDEWLNGHEPEQTMDHSIQEVDYRLAN